jgi:hypothetical protein
MRKSRRTAGCTDWRLLTATHNLAKLHRHRLATVGGPKHAPRRSDRQPLRAGREGSIPAEPPREGLSPKRSWVTGRPKRESDRPGMQHPKPQIAAGSGRYPLPQRDSG